MLSKLAVPAVAALALSLTACGGGGASTTSGHSSRGASRPTRLYRIRLSGTAETPLGARDGTGTAIIAFHGDRRVCWRFAHLHGFTHATRAHIYAGAKGHAGNVVVPLAAGRRLHHVGCTSLSAALTKQIWSKPSGYYVEIHSQQYPNGAVRGQL